LSVVLAGGEEERIRARKTFHILYAGNQRVARTKDITVLAQGLFAELERILVVDREDALFVQTPAVAMNGKIALVPEFLRQTLGRLGRRPELAGLRVPVDRLVAVDPDTGKVVPATPKVEIPDDALPRLAKLYGMEAPTAAPRVDRPTSPDIVIGYLSGAEPEDHGRPISRARALYCLATETVNLPKVGIDRSLEGLARLVEDAGCYAYYQMGMTPQQRTQMMTLVVDLLGGT